VFSSQNFLGNKTLFLFSSTNCGASKEVSDYMNSEDFKLPYDLKLANAFALDKKETVQKYLKNKKTDFSIITNEKGIETKYQISGYPILYLIDENGVIAEIYDGNIQIIQFLKSVSQK
jgi:hypothetical protein